MSHGGRFVIGILRDGEARSVEVVPQLMSGDGTTRAVLWSGALLQAPHLALAAQYRTPRGGVYISRHWFGSPSTRYRLEATGRIVEVDGRPVSDLDEFLAAVGSKRDREAVRLKTLDLDGKPTVITLKLDLEYWPTYELRRNDGVWERVGRLEPNPSAPPTSLVDVPDDASPPSKRIGEAEVAPTPSG